MAETFSTIGLIGKYGDPSVIDTLKRLSDYLTQRGLGVLLDESTAAVVTGHGLEVAPRAVIGSKCDLAIVVGGDGTLLNAARSLADHEVPLLGINLGRLGFLVDVSPDELTERLDEILGGDYLEEDRILLHMRIEREGEFISASDAFNDVVIHKWEVARMIEIETYVDGVYVNTIRSDGLIVSTPTGSTAYALSGGGPILHPTLNAVVMVPICPHTMSNRPIVIDGDSAIAIVVSEGSHEHAQVTCDGQINLGLMAGDRVHIRRKDKPVRLLHPARHDHYDILRAKLHWGEKL